MLALPDELLRQIFNELAPRTLHIASITVRKASYQSLCAAALVCRAWTASAQCALFRWVSISQTSLVEDCGRLPAVVGTLERGHSSAVRALHLGLGEVLQDDNLEMPQSFVQYDDASRASHLALAARAISLCVNLVHLSLHIGLPFDREGVAFDAGSIARLSDLHRLHQLSFYNVPHADLYSTSRGPRAPPGFSLAMQLMRTFASQLTILDIDYWISINRTVAPPEPLALPRLHTLRARGMPEELEAALRHAAPALAHVYLDAASDESLYFIPETVSHLALRAPLLDDDTTGIARFQAIETLVLDGREDTVVHTLESAPTGVRILAMAPFWVRDSLDARYLKDLFARLERLQRLVVIDAADGVGGNSDYAAIAGVPVTIVKRSEYVSLPGTLTTTLWHYTDRATVSSNL